ncbi:MAG: penicillin acylase family protein, partial [Gemmatimonadota bacterium]|nr:penicillin acylase family protein [Gemmatimonadota bacterium]
MGGSRTADGHPLLANDMHLSLRAPATWYLNVLRAEDTGLAVAGLSIPGAPGVIVGLNRWLAWGFTNAMVDDADFVVESLDLDGSRYRDTNGWRTFDTREESIVVRGRTEPERFTVRSTRRGPVVTDVL